jgi:peptide subunit release factor 1 (eRF1)
VLVGVEQATKEFEPMLADPIGKRVIGRLTADFKQENDDQILERARKLREEDERATEAALVDQIRGYAEAGTKGALGIEDTLRSLVEGRVDTLVVADGTTHEGSACLNCDYFAPYKFTHCPMCGQRHVEQLEDIVEHAIEYAIANSSQVNVVFGAPREMLLSLGGIGALLRYAVGAPSR